MKKAIYTIGFVLLTSFITDLQLPAQKIIDVGFGFGLSTPNNKLNEIYNSSNIAIGNLYAKGIKTGYHFGMILRAPLNDEVTFVGGIGYSRFPEFEIRVMHPVADTLLLTLNMTTNIIPISAGLNYYILKDVIGIYGIGELAYNYIYTSVDYSLGILSVPLDRAVSDSRIGFGLGAGFDIDFQLLLLNIEAKYNYANLIGRVKDEEIKSYVSLGIKVFF